MKKYYYIKTFGCQMNEHDSQKIEGLLSSFGYQRAKEAAQADLILFNTCTIREKAHHKAFSEIGKSVLLKKNGQKHGTLNGNSPLIGICGCVAQEEGSRLLSRFPEIDLIFGPDQISKLPVLLESIYKTGRPAIATELINSPEDYDFLDARLVTRLHGPKAYVTIMKGCNSKCSYCIVPKVRGTEVYRSVREILEEVEYLVQRGVKEVTLLGQNVNSYRGDLLGEVSFAGLIRLISEKTDISRIRFTSPHPKDCREDLIEEYAQNSKLSPHIHLPLQSGSDSVLRRMRRAYNTQGFAGKIEKLRGAREGIAVTTDMIVGFPGESDSEFEETLEFLKKIRFDSLFAFKYSPRPYTEAFDLEESVPQRVKEERLEKLLNLQREISFEINRKLEGRLEEILVEGRDPRGRGKYSGRTNTNKIVNFSGQEGLVGDIVNVRIGRAYPNSLEGDLI